jgi:UDP-2,4-diacetamido-2,4,6-trideoxy-beta-L-altropyranose hydrolase
VKFAIRVDASTEIGIGHLMRCMTLAEELQASGEKVVFICGDLPGTPLELLRDKGFPFLKLPSESTNDAERTGEFVQQTLSQADWIIVDHYKLDSEWETRVSPFCKRVMVIDDIANRTHRCDLLLDQNLYENPTARYEGLVPQGCRKLLGPEYALLRGEFAQARRFLRKRDGVVRRILVSFGGSDNTGQTMKAVQAWQLSDLSGTHADVIIGPSNSRAREIESMCASLANVSLHVQARNIAALMSNADLAIGAAGTTTWERLCMGLPSITISVAPNQVETARATDSQGLHLYLGPDDAVNVRQMADAIISFATAPSRLSRMSELALEAVDGNGVRRVVASLN